MNARKIRRAKMIQLWTQTIQKTSDDSIIIKKRTRWKELFSRPQIVGITRIRNEEEVIEDTLSHVSHFVDMVIVYDDCSTDRTLTIVKSNKTVKEIIVGEKWHNDRVAEETRHRQILLEEAKKYNPKWIFYFDADERYDFSRESILELPANVDGVKVNFFDAYMTPNDRNPYKQGIPLMNFRKYFGPEMREILVLFRNKEYINFRGLDAREPEGCKRVVHRNFCQHYGKSLSVQQWEETCEYYSTFFPEPYKSKWEQRKGKAIHEVSDFGNPLYDWNSVKWHAITI